jgi:hypothetical protein
MELLLLIDYPALDPALIVFLLDRAMGPHGPGLRAIWAPICGPSHGS